MIYLKRFVLMIQFLTRIPIPVNLEVKNEDFGKGLIFAPLVGMIIGCILALSYFILSKVFTATITAVMVFVIYILITGGLHLDGLGDTFDGLFSNRSKERMLEIMRDSRVGTNAVLAIVCVLLLNILLMSEIQPMYMLQVLILMPAAGRIASLIGSGISAYARSSDGLGKSFIECCGAREIVQGLVIYFILFGAIGQTQGIIISVFPVIISFLLTRFFSRKIGGATGDILGAVCELNQTFFLLAVYALQQVV